MRSGDNSSSINVSHGKPSSDSCVWLESPWTAARCTYQRSPGGAVGAIAGGGDGPAGSIDVHAAVRVSFLDGLQEILQYDEVAEGCQMAPPTSATCRAGANPSDDLQSPKPRLRSRLRVLSWLRHIQSGQLE